MTDPSPIDPRRVEKSPEDMAASAAAPASATEVSSVTLESANGSVITVVMITDPLKTPTTLTLDVSTMLRRAHKLLMKLVMWLSSLKKSFISMAKWVVN